MNKKLIALGLVITLAGIVTFGVSKAKAQSSDTSPFLTIIQKLAQRFNLQEADVQTVFDEVKLERQTQMQVKFEERLTQQVKDGKLNESQKLAVIAKHKELREKHLENWEKLNGLTPQQRREDMQKQRSELESWANAQGIDVNLIFGYGKHPKFHGMEQMHKWQQ